MTKVLEVGSFRRQYIGLTLVTVKVLQVFAYFLVFLALHTWSVQVIKRKIGSPWLCHKDAWWKCHYCCKCVKIEFFIIMCLSDAKLQYISGSLLTVVHELHLGRNLWSCCYLVAFCSLIEIDDDNANWVLHLSSYCWGLQEFRLWNWINCVKVPKVIFFL